MRYPYSEIFWSVFSLIRTVSSGKCLETQGRVGEHVWQRISSPLPPLILWRAPYIVYQPFFTFFKFCPNSDSPALFVASFFRLNVSSRHILWDILLNGIIDINLLSLGTLVLAAASCVFRATRHQINGRLETDGMVFASTLICYYTRRH